MNEVRKMSLVRPVAVALAHGVALADRMDPQVEIISAWQPKALDFGNDFFREPGELECAADRLPAAFVCVRLPMSQLALGRTIPRPSTTAAKIAALPLMADDT